MADDWGRLLSEARAAAAPNLELGRAREALALAHQEGDDAKGEVCRLLDRIDRLTAALRRCRDALASAQWAGTSAPAHVLIADHVANGALAEALAAALGEAG